MHTPVPHRIACTRVRRPLRSALACIGAVAAAACSGNASTGVTQTVARVDGAEITELQVNQVLERQRGLRPDMVEAAGTRAVQALVDQEVVLQKARDLKLDRESRVAQQVEQARREIVARAYLERIADGASPPAAEEAVAYYQAHPYLFAERQLYTLQELLIDTQGVDRQQIESDLKGLRSPAELEAYLKQRQLRARAEQRTVAAESLPLALAERLARVRPGSGLVVPSGDAVRVVFVVQARPAPVAIEQARPAIEAYLLNERKRAAIEREVGSLRAAAKIEYLGKYRELAASGVPPAPAASAPVLALPAAGEAASDVAPAEERASGVDAGTLTRGIQGLR